MAEAIRADVAWRLARALAPEEGNSQSQVGTATVTRVDADGTVWVRIPGSGIDTPANGTVTAAAEPGQTVGYRIESGRLSVTGNVSSPAVGGTYVTQVVEPVERKADEAMDEAWRAHEAADAAETDARRAHDAAESAQQSAATANRAANDALTQLSFVEDVAGTLDWIQSHGTFTATTDTTVQEGKVYFELVSGDYVPVASPSGNPSQQGWYELDVTDSQTDYIMAHLAVTSAGLWVLPSGIDGTDAQHSSGYKALLANDGMRVYDDSGTAVATYGSSVTFADDRDWQVGSSNAYVRYDSSDDTLLVGGPNVSIDGEAVFSAINGDTGTTKIDGGKIDATSITIGGSGLATQSDVSAAQQAAIDAIPDPTDFYGTCSTAAGTAAKVVVCDGFVADTGTRLTVKFSTASTQNVPTLTIKDNTEAVLMSATAVWFNNAVASSNNPVRWGAKATLHFVYDGTVWVLDEKPPSYSTTSSTAATTRAKAAAQTGALVVNGTRVTVRFSTANTYVANSVQLNFAATGAGNIYRNNAVTSATNTLLWNANTVLTFTHQTQYWFLADNGTRTMSEEAAKTATNYISADSSGIRIANADPATATTYQHQTATSTEFVVEGVVAATHSGYTSVIGPANMVHTEIGSSGFVVSDGEGTPFIFTTDVEELTDLEPFYSDGYSDRVSVTTRTDGEPWLISVNLTYQWGSDSGSGTGYYYPPYRIAEVLAVDGDENIVDGVIDSWRVHEHNGVWSISIQPICDDTAVHTYNLSFRVRTNVWTGQPGLQIGTDESSHMKLDYRSMRLIDASGDAYMQVSDMRDRDGNVELTWVVGGSQTYFRLSIEALDTSYGVYVNDSEVTPSEKAVDHFRLGTPPAVNSRVTAVIQPSVERHAKAYVLGVEPTSGEVFPPGGLSVREGLETVADGFCAHAEGNKSQARGGASHAEGVLTRAGGDASHAEGAHAVADGQGSHAQNLGTVANGMNQTAIGRYNVADNGNAYALIVGNGSSDTNRSNALTVDWSGNVDAAGEVTQAVDTTAVCSVETGASSIATNAIERAGNVVTVTLATIKLAASLAANGAVNVATVPDGYRPSHNLYFPFMAYGQTGVFGYARINSSGVVQVRNTSTTAINTSAELCFTATYVIE